MADEEQPTPKPRATRAKKADEVTPEVSVEIPMMAEALTPDEEVKKPAARKPAAVKSRAVDTTTAKSIVAGKAEKAEAKPRAKADKPARKVVAKKGDSPLDVRVYDGAGEQSGELRLPESIFGQAPNMGVMHQALQRQLNNARQGTSSTKTRAMVSGGGRKPFRQKGLGRSRTARSGSRAWSAAASPSALTHAATGRRCRARCAGSRCAPLSPSRPRRAG